MYFGCGTRANRARWLVEGALVLVAVALLVVYGLEVQTCDKCRTVDGVDHCSGVEGVTKDPIDVGGLEGCSRGLLLAALVGSMISGSLALLLLAYMAWVQPPDMELVFDDNVYGRELPISAATQSCGRTKSLAGRQQNSSAHSGSSFTSITFAPGASPQRAASSVSPPKGLVGKGTWNPAAAAAAAAAIAKHQSGREDSAHGHAGLLRTTGTAVPSSAGTVLSSHTRVAFPSSIHEGLECLDDPEGYSSELHVAAQVAAELAAHRPVEHNGPQSLQTPFSAVSAASGPSDAGWATAPASLGEHDVPVLLDVGPVAETAAAVEASVNGLSGSMHLELDLDSDVDSDLTLPQGPTVRPVQGPKSADGTRCSAASTSGAGYRSFGSNGPWSSSAGARHGARVAGAEEIEIESSVMPRGWAAEIPHMYAAGAAPQSQDSMLGVNQRLAGALFPTAHAFETTTPARKDRGIRADASADGTHPPHNSGRQASVAGTSSRVWPPPMYSVAARVSCSTSGASSSSSAHSSVVKGSAAYKAAEGIERPDSAYEHSAGGVYANAGHPPICYLEFAPRTPVSAPASGRQKLPPQSPGSQASSDNAPVAPSGTGQVDGSAEIQPAGAYAGSYAAVANGLTPQTVGRGTQQHKMTQHAAHSRQDWEGEQRSWYSMMMAARQHGAHGSSSTGTPMHQHTSSESSAGWEGFNPVAALPRSVGSMTPPGRSQHYVSSRGVASAAGAVSEPLLAPASTGQLTGVPRGGRNPVSTAWARVTGAGAGAKSPGLEGANAWYHSKKQPRSAGPSFGGGPPSSGGGSSVVRLDAAWVAFTRQEVADKACERLGVDYDSVRSPMSLPAQFEL